MTRCASCSLRTVCKASGSRLRFARRWKPSGGIGSGNCSRSALSIMNLCDLGMLRCRSFKESGDRDPRIFHPRFLRWKDHDAFEAGIRRLLADLKVEDCALTAVARRLGVCLSHFGSEGPSFDPVVSLLSVRAKRMIKILFLAANPEGNATRSVSTRRCGPSRSGYGSVGSA